VVREAAAVIASPPVRNMGTMGGSVAFADPAADYLPALVAADAEVEIVGPGGGRRLSIAEFLLDWYQTALGAGRADRGPASASGAPGSGWPLRQAVTRRGRLRHRLGGGGAGDERESVQPHRRGRRRLRAEAGPAGRSRTGAARRSARRGRLESGGTAARGSGRPVDDVRSSAEYRRRVIPRLVRRAVRSAAARIA